MRQEGYVHGFEIDADHFLHIYQGSLVGVQADALVSSDDNYLSGGGVSFALARAAGRDVDRERHQLVQEHRPTLGDVVRTSGGGLPCRFIYHAITIDFDRYANMDESSLRKLIANLLKQATADGVRSIGMPALGTGVASFELGLASEIIIDDLLVRLNGTPIQRVTLALIGDEAERLFYERIVRAQTKRLASLELRRRESRLLADLRVGAYDERALVAAAVEAGKILEQALKHLIRMYGFVFFGADFEAELVRRKVIAPRRDGSVVSRLTIGQSLEALERLSSLMNQDVHLKARRLALGTTLDDLLSRKIWSGADRASGRLPTGLSANHRYSERFSSHRGQRLYRRAGRDEHFLKTRRSRS